MKEEKLTSDLGRQDDVSSSNSNGVKRIYGWVDKWIFEGIEKFVLAFGLLSVSIIVFLIVITRYFFGYSPDWSDELPRYIIVWVTFIGMSYCVRKGEHVIIDILFNKLKIKIRKVFYITLLIISFLTFVYLTYISFDLTKKIFATNQQSITLNISMGWIYLALPVGCFLSANNYFHLIIRNVGSNTIWLNLNERGN